MYRIGCDDLKNIEKDGHNIRISELKPNKMSQPRKVIHLPKVRLMARGMRPSSGIRITNMKTIKPPDPELVRKQEEEKLKAQPKMIHLPKVRLMARGGRPSSGIRITNVKIAKPPDPELVKKQEEEKLRAQLQKEIVSRSKTCAFSQYKCLVPVAANYPYCLRHLSKHRDFRDCAHQNCSMPAPNTQEHSLCYSHARAALRARQRSAAPPAPVPSAETRLHQLQHYVKQERQRSTSCASSVSVVSDPADQEQVTVAADPFKQIDGTAVNAAYSSSIMECCSASDSDGDDVTIGLGGTSRKTDTVEFEEAETETQPLWRAGIFTAEEAVSEARNTLKSLQSAYVKQMSRLKTLLQMARLQYLRQLKTEREQYCSIYRQSVTGNATARERRQLRKLKAYAGYRRKHGVDAVLARKLHHKRAKVNEPTWTRPIPSQGRCTFTEGGVRCSTHVLPASKFCTKHILSDRNQVLFIPCGDMRGGQPCCEPIAKLPLPSSTCRYHTNPPTYTVFTLKKDESDSDSDASSTVSQISTGGEHSELPPSDLAPEACA